VFINTHLNVRKVIRTSSYASKFGVRHTYFKQHLKGIEIANGDIAVHIDKNNRIIAYGETAYKQAHAKSVLWPQLSLDQMIASQKMALAAFYMYIKRPFNPLAINIMQSRQKNGNATMFIKDVPLAVIDVTSKQVYIQNEKGAIQPAWEFIINMGINHFQIHVSIDGKNLLSVIDWTSAARYNAIPVGDENILTNGFKTIIDPHLPDSSPTGWHTVFGARSMQIMDNNAIAKMQTDDSTPQCPTSATNNYDFIYYPDSMPIQNAGLAVTNAFYVTNMMHDIFYRYGFNEQAGNFQMDNFGKGGFEGDPIEVFVQSSDVQNNAFFTSPPDGQKGKLYLGTDTFNNRLYDHALDNDSIIHELTHGLSERLVGGPANAGCLTKKEADAMGEGWSDFIAIWTRMKETDNDLTVFRFSVYANSNGVRVIPYSLRKKEHLPTYRFFNFDGWDMSHRAGIVWGNILYQMQRNIHNTMKRFSNDIKTPSLDASNTLVMQMIVLAMQLLPCNPTYSNGRDALIQADHILTDGKYTCEIYTVFARHGVGPKALRIASFDTVKEDFTIPNQCKEYSHLLNDPILL
jgi:extracellular elastinolytic metalloproteinase